MRNAIVRQLIKLARADRRVCLVVGDVGYSVVEPFRDEFPERFVNAGVAEQNMMGVSAGLALSGKTVFTYTFANFTVLRCLEQIRNDVCFHNANVKILGVGGGLAYGAQGMTHHGTQDLAVLSALPNIAVMSPADPIEASLAVEAASRWRGPCYIQLRRSGEKPIYRRKPKFRIGRANVVREGSDVALIGVGWILHNALAAADILKKKGIEARVVSMATLKPVDEKAILECAAKTPHIVTVEENSSKTLGAHVAGVISRSGGCTPLLVLGLPDEYATDLGSQEYMLSRAGLSPEGISKSVLKFMGGKVG